MSTQPVDTVDTPLYPADDGSGAGGTGGTGGTGVSGSGTSSGTTTTSGNPNLTIPDLELQILGRPTTTKYPDAAWIIPTGSVVTLCVDDDGINPPVYGYYSGTRPASLPANRYVIMTGTFS